MTFKLLVPEKMTQGIIVPDGSEMVRYHPKEPIPAKHHDADGIVIWGSTGKWLVHTAKELQNLQWVQSLTAGSDLILAAGFTPDAIITSGVGLHDSPVSEHALALMLTASRSMHALYESQKSSSWNFELGGFQDPDAPKKFTEIRGSRIAIWGFGSIANTLAPILRDLGADVIGIATRPRNENGFVVHSSEDVNTLLPTIDVLIMLLPSMPETDNVLNQETLTLLPKHAWVFNLGRGNAIDEEALVDALEAGTIAGAGLDVMKTEPLPAESRLWGAKNIIITPHAAGGRPVNPGTLITENWNKLLSGKTLTNFVKRT